MHIKCLKWTPRRQIVFMNSYCQKVGFKGMDQLCQLRIDETRCKSGHLTREANCLGALALGR